MIYRERDWHERKKGRERWKEKESETEYSEQEKRRSAGNEMGRKFSSDAFICSLNEMRMHYTWIAGDINFLPWTCSGPRARQGHAGKGWSNAQGSWVAIHPIYNIYPVRVCGCDRPAHTAPVSRRRGGGKVEKREVAVPRAVSCSHVQPRASFCRVFYILLRAR